MRDVLDVFATNASDASIGIEIEIALGHAEATLRQVGGLNVAPLLVLVDVESEKWPDLQRTLSERDVHHVVGVPDGVDAGELGVERMNALPLDLYGVHRRRPEVTDFLSVASRGGVGRGRFLVDLAQIDVQLLADLVANTPRRFRGRDRMPLEPATIGILEEVDGWADGGVQIGGEEVAGGGGGRGGGGVRGD